jgi:hypothetical protein
MLENFINGLYLAGASAKCIVLQTGGKASFRSLCHEN